MRNSYFCYITGCLLNIMDVGWTKKRSLFEEICFKHLLISSYSKPFIITFRRLLRRVKMQLSVTFPDAGFPDVVFTASGESLVKDALQVAADEWGTDADFLELSLAGSRLRAGSRLVSYGVEDGSLLDASVVRLFGLEWFTDSAKRAKAFLRGERDQDGFLCLDTPTFAVDGCLQFSNSEWFSDDVTNISFSNSEPSVTTVSDDFLSSFHKVIRVSLSGLQYVTSVGNDFLKNCNSLSSVDLSSLSNVSVVGNLFLFSCSSLTSLDLSSLSNISAVGNSFLSYCSSLTSLDLSSLSNLSTVGHSFLCDCSSLTSLDLSSLSNLSTVGYSFLGRLSLTSLDLSSLSNLSTVGDSFLCDCSSLTSLDLSSLSNLSTVGDYFLNNCSSLTSLDLSSLSNLSTVGNSFLKKCSSLTSLDLTLVNVESVGSNFLEGCSSIDRNKLHTSIRNLK